MGVSLVKLDSILRKKRSKRPADVAHTAGITIKKIKEVDGYTKKLREIELLRINKNENKRDNSNLFHPNTTHILDSFNATSELAEIN